MVLLNRQTTVVNSRMGSWFPSGEWDERDAYYEQAERRRTDVTLNKWHDQPDAALMVL